MEVKDSIMEKLRKIKALMDGGEAGEVEAARMALERLMEASEDKIDDLGSSGSGVNILDVAKSFALIQKPELIKELK